MLYLFYSFYHRIFKFLVFLLFIFATFFVVVRFKLGNQTQVLAADGDPVIDFTCIGEQIANYSDTVAVEAGSLPYVKLISPVFNMTHPNFSEMFGSYVSSANLANITAFAGNAYNVGGHTTISQYLNAWRALAPSKDIILTEMGWHEYAVCDSSDPNGQPPPEVPCVDKTTALGRLTSEVSAISSASDVMGALFFNGFGTGGAEWAYFDVTADIGALCSGTCSNKLGINSAAYHAQQSDFYTSVSYYGMRYTLEISDGDLPTSKNLIDRAFAAGVTPIIRIGDQTGVGGGFENPSAYAAYLQELNTYIADVKGGAGQIYAIAGPNEPESECWASSVCGCGSPYFQDDSLVPVTVKGHVYSRDPSKVLTSYGTYTENPISRAPVNNAVVRAYSGSWGVGDVLDGIGGKVDGKITDAPSAPIDIPSRCAVTGRRTTDTVGKLDCEAQATQCDPGVQNCAGYFEFTTYITGHNYNSGNYILFFCDSNGDGSSMELAENYWISLPPGNTDDIYLDVTVPCGADNAYYEEPGDEITFVNENVAECSESEKLTPYKNVALDFYSKSTLIDRAADGRYLGADPTDPSAYNNDGDGDLPPSASVLSSTDLEARAGLVPSVDLRSIRAGLFQLCGSPQTYLEPPLEGAAPQYPNCEDLRLSNQTLAIDNKQDYNSHQRYNAPLKMLSPVDQENYYEANIVDLSTGEMKQAYKDLTVCTDNAGLPVTLGQIQPPYEEFDPNVHIHTDDFWPYCAIFGSDIPAASSEYWTWPENDSYWNGDLDPREAPIDFAGEDLGGAPGDDDDYKAGKEAVISIYPSGHGKTGLSEFGLMKSSKLTYVNELANVFATPYVDYESESVVSAETAQIYDKTRTIKRIGIPNDLCTYSIKNEASKGESNNEFKKDTDQENKWVTTGKWATDESRSLGSCTSALGIPSNLCGLLTGFLNLVNSFFPWNQTNISLSNPVSACTPEEWQPVGGSCDLSNPDCRAVGCFITASIICDTLYDPTTGGCNCEAAGYDTQAVCSGGVLPDGTYTCSYERLLASPYECLGDEKVLAKVNTFAPVHPQIANYGMTPYVHLFEQPYEKQYRGECMIEATHALTKQELPKASHYMDQPGGDCLVYNMYNSLGYVADPYVGTDDYVISDPGVPGPPGDPGDPGGPGVPGDFSICDSVETAPAGHNVKPVGDIIATFPSAHSDNIARCYNYLVERALTTGNDPAFIMAIWIEESGASNYDLYPSVIDFGCGSTRNNFGTGLECMLSLQDDYTNPSDFRFECSKIKPSTNSMDVEEFFQPYACGPGSSSLGTICYDTPPHFDFDCTATNQGGGHWPDRINSHYQQVHKTGASLDFDKVLPSNDWSL